MWCFWTWWKIPKFKVIHDRGEKRLRRDVLGKGFGWKLNGEIWMESLDTGGGLTEGDISVNVNEDNRVE